METSIVEDSKRILFRRSLNWLTHCNCKNSEETEKPDPQGSFGAFED
jgi:hypothetical protein